jgi:TRAP-type mannitol/chloroaromatic compound transport system permease small subunit
MWLILATTLISANDTIVRRIFDSSSDAKIQWYLFAGVFLLGAGYGLLKIHMCASIFFPRASDRTRNWIDVVGIWRCCSPFCVIIISAGSAVHTGAGIR